MTGDIFHLPMQPTNTPEEREKMRRVMAVCEGMVALVQTLPPEHHMSAMLSFVVSGLVNANDPLGFWQELKRSIDRRLPAALDQVQAFEASKPN